MTKHWINTVSRDHVQIGVEGGFTQAGHGKSAPLKRLDEGDLIAFYSPRAEFRSARKLQAFTAIGRVADQNAYQVEVSEDFRPWRRHVDFAECEEAPIQPLIPDLDFIEDEHHWGYPFRRGLFRIEWSDFERIAAAMRVRVEAI